LKRKNILIASSYATIYIVWGSTYFFIKMAVETIPPFYVIGLRWLGGGILFLVYLLFWGRVKRLPTAREILAALALGLLLLVGGNGMITIAEQKVDSYLAAVILASTPIVVAFFDRFLIGKRLHWLALTGILTGISGVGVLLYNGHSMASSLTPEIWLVLLGLLCWGFATSLGHRVPVHEDILVNTTMQMLLIGLLCLGGMILFSRQGLAAIWPDFSARSLFGLGYLTIFGSLAFVAYNYLIIHEPAIRIVSYAFINPIIAVLLGLLVGHERPVPLLGPGILLIIIGLFFMLYGPILLEWVMKRPGASMND
jgi:drug/metabolite transporter (DMT)-like permease